jgi:hypothetical protein
VQRIDHTEGLLFVSPSDRGKKIGYGLLDDEKWFGVWGFRMMLNVERKSFYLELFLLGLADCIWLICSIKALSRLFE